MHHAHPSPGFLSRKRRNQSSARGQTGHRSLASSWGSCRSCKERLRPLIGQGPVRIIEKYRKDVEDYCRIDRSFLSALHGEENLERDACWDHQLMVRPSLVGLDPSYQGWTAWNKNDWIRTTDENGEVSWDGLTGDTGFSVLVLSPKRGRFVAVDEAEQPEVDPRIASFLPKRPSSWSQPLRLRVGEEATARFQVEGDLASLRGTALPPKLLEGITGQVTLQIAGPSSPLPLGDKSVAYASAKAPNGSFAFDRLPAGRYHVRFLWEAGQDIAFASRTVELGPGEDRDLGRITIDAVPSFELRFAFRDEEGNALAEVLREELPPLSVSFGLYRSNAEEPTMGDSVFHGFRRLDQEAHSYRIHGARADRLAWVAIQHSNEPNAPDTAKPHRYSLGEGRQGTTKPLPIPATGQYTAWIELRPAVITELDLSGLTEAQRQHSAITLIHDEQGPRAMKLHRPKGESSAWFEASPGRYAALLLRIIDPGWHDPNNKSYAGSGYFAVRPFQHPAPQPLRVRLRAGRDVELQIPPGLIPKASTWLNLALATKAASGEWKPSMLSQVLHAQPGVPISLRDLPRGFSFRLGFVGIELTEESKLLHVPDDAVSAPLRWDIRAKRR